MVINGEASTSSNGGVNINVFCCSNGKRFSVKADLESTVLEFKTFLAGNEKQRLIYNGRILNDDQTLSSYGLQADHTVHMVGFPPAKPTASTPTNVMNASNSPAVALGDVPNSRGTVLGGAGAGTGIPLLPGLSLSASLAHGLFEAGFSEIEQVQQPLTQNPNPMRVIRRMPMRHRQMLDVIDRNPVLGGIRINDPSTPRQSSEAPRNHVLTPEVPRNADRARRNIESSPGGFNPFASGSERTSRTAGPNVNPLPNPRSNNGTGVTRTNPIGRAPPSPLGLPDVGIIAPPIYSQRLLNRARRTRNLDIMLRPPLYRQPLLNRERRTLNLFPEPQNIEQMASPNPQLPTMLDMTTQLRQMMQNPDVLRQVPSPELMQQLMALGQQISQLIRQHITTDREEGAQTGQNLENQTRSEFGAVVAAGATNVTSNPNGPREDQELYATQLSQMREVGLYRTEENIRALRATSGDVNDAVELILTKANF